MLFYLLHKHFWSTPRKQVDGQFDGQFLMTCYDCGKHRKLHVDMSDQPEKRHLMASPSKSK